MNAFLVLAVICARPPELPCEQLIGEWEYLLYNDWPMRLHLKRDGSYFFYYRNAEGDFVKERSGSWSYDGRLLIMQNFTTCVVHGRSTRAELWLTRPSGELIVGKRIGVPLPKPDPRSFSSWAVWP